MKRLKSTYNKKKYPDMTTHQMMGWGGFIPLWITEWNLRRTSFAIQETLFDYLHKQYEARSGMGIKGRKLTGEIDNEGVLRHPEDSPMYPFMSWHTEEGEIYFYPYSVMAIPTLGNQHFITRMD